MKQSEEYRSRHSMEVPGKSTEAPGKSTEAPGKSTEAPDNCQELPWSRKKSLYGCHENAAWQCSHSYRHLGHSSHHTQVSVPVTNIVEAIGEP